eukprot:TRINITY_DN6164_c0_g6_i1.p1 TRINITY_DN6164_c0_g6~~TRINITY_DN6164_c0_g6_i1.p1  ORF type:complete len:280 (+),score=57.54 TRINITY_DN6164_c0_g6_i1:118-957(+)
MSPSIMDAGRWAEAEQWLVMALRAARSAAVDKTELKALRWHIFETSHSCCVVPVKLTVANCAIEGLEEVLAAVKHEANLPGVVKVEDAKRWMRSTGPRGLKAASLLGRLSSCRNDKAHPLAKQLLEEVKQLNDAKHDDTVEETPIEKTIEKIVEAPVEKIIKKAVKVEEVMPNPLTADVGCVAEAHEIYCATESSRPDSSFRSEFQSKVDAHRALYPRGKLPAELLDFDKFMKQKKQSLDAEQPVALRKQVVFDFTTDTGETAKMCKGCLGPKSLCLCP